MRRVMHIFGSKLNITGSVNGLPPCRQAIIWTNAGILLIGPVNSSEILIEIQNVLYEKVVILSRSQCVKVRKLINMEGSTVC